MTTWPKANQHFVSGVREPEEISDAWYFVFSSGEILLRTDERDTFLPFEHGDREFIESIQSKLHFMGMHGDTACYAVEVERTLEVLTTETFTGLRSLFGKTDNAMLALAGRAQQICEWFPTHQYCGKCGCLTRPQENDRSMVCDDCRISSYPRLSPSIIVLVHRGNEVLLARSHRFPAGMYSTLAGFVEPGESIEETLVREVKEEVGVTVCNLEYRGSQPWPFPNSLMLGFHAEYLHGDIVLQEEEIEDAKWFDISDLPDIPGKIAISRWLIDDYLHQKGLLE